MHIARQAALPSNFMTQARRQWTTIVVVLAAVLALTFGGLKYQNDREQRQEDKVLDGFVDHLSEP